MRSGARTTTKGAATTASPNPTEDWTTDPASTTRPSARTAAGTARTGPTCRPTPGAAAVGADHDRAHRLGILGAEIEDLPDLDAAALHPTVLRDGREGLRVVALVGAGIGGGPVVADRLDRGPVGEVHHARGPDEARRRQLAHVGTVAARDPVARGVDVGADVLAGISPALQAFQPERQCIGAEDVDAPPAGSASEGSAPAGSAPEGSAPATTP